MQHLPMGDKELATDLLMMEKAIAERYHWGALEAVHPQVRQTLEQIHEELGQNARRIFDLIHRRGWVQPWRADPQTMQSFQNTLHKMRQEVGSIPPTLPPAAQQPWAIAGAHPGWYPQTFEIPPAHPAPSAHPAQQSGDLHGGFVGRGGSACP